MAPTARPTPCFEPVSLTTPVTRPIACKRGECGAGRPKPARVFCASQPERGRGGGRARGPHLQMRSRLRRASASSPRSEPVPLAAAAALPIACTRGVANLITPIGRNRPPAPQARAVTGGAGNVGRVACVLPLIRELYRTTVLVAGCLGLRVSEITARKWADFDFEALTLLVQHSRVHDRGGGVKTDYSRDSVPLDPALVQALRLHQERSYSASEGWLFANPVTGKPYHREEIQKRHIRKAGIDAKIGSDIGWHTFRHSYRSWLDETGAPLTVQKELMRHASIQTTMNIYGKATTDTKRQAHRKVVEMVLKSKKSEKATASRSRLLVLGTNGSSRGAQESAQLVEGIGCGGWI